VKAIGKCKCECVSHLLTGIGTLGIAIGAIIASCQTNDILTKVARIDEVIALQKTIKDKLDQKDRNFAGYSTGKAITEIEGIPKDLPKIERIKKIEEKVKAIPFAVKNEDFSGDFNIVAPQHFGFRGEEARGLAKQLEEIETTEGKQRFLFEALMLKLKTERKDR